MKTYQIKDHQVTESYSSFNDLVEAAVEFIELTIDSYGEFRLSDGQKARLQKTENIKELQSVIDEILDEIALFQGYRPWAGHGNFYCSPAEEAGYYITVEEI